MSFVYESNDFSMRDAITQRGGFSYNAAVVLLERLQELADCMGEPIELDPIGLRCEWSEYETVEAMAIDMGWSDHIVRVAGDLDPEETLENIDHHEGCEILRVDHDGPFLVRG